MIFSRTPTFILRTLLLGVGLLGWTLTASADPIRIVAWNIEWFPGKQMVDVTPEMEKAHLAIAQNVLKDLKPDILVSSEIRDWRSFDDLVSIIPGLKVVAVSNFRDRDLGQLSRQQVTIASRLPVKAAWSEEWKATLPSLIRGFSFAAIAAPGQDNKFLLVYSLHLKSNRSSNEAQAQINFHIRNESIAQLLIHVQEMERITFQDRIHGIIVGGDFNTNHDGQFGDKVVEMMVAAGFHNTWDGVPKEQRLTWRGSDQFPPTTFDYIFTKGLGQPKARLVEVPAEASDHHAIMVEIP
jgi:endonuclease/exonuclease/phosphatase family metal-dependent hydrolase